MLIFSHYSFHGVFPSITDFLPLFFSHLIVLINRSVVASELPLISGYSTTYTVPSNDDDSIKSEEINGAIGGVLFFIAIIVPFLTIVGVSSLFP